MTTVHLPPNQLSGKCLHAAGDISYVYERECNGGDNQQWRLQYNNEGSAILFVNKESDKCLHGSAFEYTCNGSSNMEWKLQSNNEGSAFLLVNRETDKCLIPVHSRVFEYDCLGSDIRQQWSIELQSVR